MPRLGPFTLTLAMLLAQPGCTGASGCDAGTSCTRVLFIGNSYTFVNDLPDMFAQLSAAAGDPVDVAMLAQGGWTLAEHAAAPLTSTTLTSTRWDVVVLQEQSEIPAAEQLRETAMYPAARALIGMIHRQHARPMFFLTWAHRDGEGGANYAQMQAAVDQGYRVIAAEQHVAVAPVGDAWARAIGQPGIAGLWQGDGSHPSVEGTYLAACVFFAAIFHRSPAGIAYTADLPRPEATALQRIAAAAVPGAHAPGSGG